VLHQFNGSVTSYGLYTNLDAVQEKLVKVNKMFMAF